MVSIRHTLDGYGADTRVSPDTQEPQSIDQKKEALRKDIDRIDQMDIDELNALDDRVSKSLSDTVSRIEKFKAEAQTKAPDEAGFDWLRRADYARSSFFQAKKLIHRRKVEIEKERQHEFKKQNRAVAQKLELERLETDRKRQEEKTKRHQSEMVRQVAIYKKVMGFIRGRGLLTEPEIIQLYRDAEAIVDGPANGRDDA